MVRGQAEGDDVTRSSPNVGVGWRLRAGQGREPRQGRQRHRGSGHVDVKGRGGQEKGVERKRTEEDE